MNPLTRARWIIVIVGILLPYLERIPGMLVYGPEWLWSYLDAGAIIGGRLGRKYDQRLVTQPQGDTIDPD